MVAPLSGTPGKPTSWFTLSMRAAARWRSRTLVPRGLIRPANEMILALNKIDLKPRDALLPITQALFGNGAYGECS